MTSVGYGDISPKTVLEMGYVNFVMLISSGVFAYTIGNIGEMVAKINLLAAQYKEKMIYVNQFMKMKDVPKDLRSKIRKYLEYVWDIKKELKIEEEEVFETLNDNLRE